MDMIMRFPGGNAKAFTMSYDDGTYQDYRLVDIMQKHGLKGTFNINSMYVSKTDAVKDDQRLSAKQIKELSISLGNELAIHTCTHPTLVDLPPQRISYEYLRDREILEDMFATVIRGSAYPNSRYNQKVISCIKSCGLAYARGGNQTESFELPNSWYELMPTVRHANPKLMEITGKFLELAPMAHHPSALFLLMGHSHEFWRNNNWELMEEFARKMGGNKDIWYTTSIELYDYIHSFNEVRFNLAMTLAENPTSTDVWVSKNGKLYELKAGTSTVID